MSRAVTVKIAPADLVLVGEPDFDPCNPPDPGWDPLNPPDNAILDGRGVCAYVRMPYDEAKLAAWRARGLQSKPLQDNKRQQNQRYACWLVRRWFDDESVRVPVHRYELRARTRARITPVRRSPSLPRRSAH